jgi:single-strand DNA-binding protein
MRKIRREKGKIIMNHATIIGRITKDPEIRYSNGSPAVAFGSYTIAVDRPTAKDKESVTDFINCKVVGKTAEFAERYLRKGMKIAIEGRLQVDKYKDDNGINRSTTYVQVSSHEFCESRQTDAPAPQKKAEINEGGWMDIPDGIDEALPFT